MSRRANQTNLKFTPYGASIKNLGLAQVLNRLQKRWIPNAYIRVKIVAQVRLAQMHKGKLFYPNEACRSLIHLCISSHRYDQFG